MNESSKKIRELTEAMRAEKDIRIRNMMMAVLGVLEGHSTRTASDFADMDRRTAQLWTVRFNESGIGGLWDAPGRGRVSCARYGRIKRLAARLAAKNILTPRKLRNWIRGRVHVRYRLCSTQDPVCWQARNRVLKFELKATRERQ